MNDKKINIVIAATTLLAALILIIALSFAIGKWSFGTSGHILIVQFPNASGLTANSEVKFAGAPIGRIKSISLIPRSEQTQDPSTGIYNTVEVTAEINANAEVGQDSSATIKQDGIGLSPKYLLLSPGRDHASPLLADGAKIQGQAPFELSDLAQPAGEALTKANHMLTDLEPTVNALSTRLVPILDKTEKLLDDGDGAIANLDSPDSREKISKLMANLRVVSDNLKVVTTNAKALTETLAEKPWRLVWGGKTVLPPDEQQVLKSDQALPLKKDVEVSMPATNNSAPAAPKPKIKPSPSSSNTTTTTPAQ